jgi:mono/diheme cytochrome c family protein
MRLALVAFFLTACAPGDEPGSEYMPDMARSPAYKAFAPNLATRDGLTLRRPVAGTVARGRQPFHYGKGEDQAARAGRELVAPPLTEDALQRGRALFQITCAVCHGAEGRGDGPLIGKIPPPPSYRSERLRAFPAGRIFHVITLGANRMPSYAAQLSPDERWQVVAYVKTVLQGDEGAAR